MAKLTLIKRSTPICPACNMMKAQLDGEGIPHDVIDITDTPEAIEQYDITGVPVLIIEREDESIVRMSGYVPVEDVKELL